MNNLLKRKVTREAILSQIFFILMICTISPLYAQTNVTIFPGQSKTFSHQIYSDATTYSYSYTGPSFITFSDLGATSFMGWVTIKYKLSVSIFAPSGIYSVTVKYKLGNSVFPNNYRYNVTTGATAVQDNNSNVPLEFNLSQNYPNPFNSTTTISYSLPRPDQVRLQIFDINGKLVKVLVDEQQSQGKYFMKWDGTNSSGQSVASGNYLYQIIAGKQIETKRMVLVK